jgi:hypothetical protein
VVRRFHASNCKTWLNLVRSTSDTSRNESCAVNKNIMRNWTPILVILATAFAVGQQQPPKEASAGANRCHDPKLRSANISGNTISATVWGSNNRSAKVHLYSERDLVWSGITDKKGGFEIHDLPSGVYRLSVEKWGTTRVVLDPMSSPISTQTVYWTLSLMENGCVAAGFSTD